MWCKAVVRTKFRCRGTIADRRRRQFSESGGQSDRGSVDRQTRIDAPDRSGTHLGACQELLGGLDETGKQAASARRLEDLACVGRGEVLREKPSQLRCVLRPGRLGSKLRGVEPVVAEQRSKS